MDVEALSTLVLLPIIAITTLGNLLWVPFDKGHRWLRFWRAIGFFVFAILAVMANTMAATEDGYDVTKGDVAMQIVFVFGLALFFSFMSPPPRKRHSLSVANTG